jgi:FkbM family methyltransferase
MVPNRHRPSIETCMIRTIVERMSRGVVLRRRLPARFGGDVLYVTPDASLRHWRLDMEKIDPQIFNLLPRIIRSGDRIWDVGANVGIFGFAAANLAGESGKVLVIEPDTWLVSLLRRSAQRPGRPRAEVEVLPIAVSDRMCMTRFNIARRGRAASHLAGVGRVQAGGLRETITVPCVTLDWLMEQYPPPQVLKIDVEGAENLVLRGGHRLLSEARPRIVCEVGRGLAPEIHALLEGANYEIIDLDAEGGAMPTQDRAFWNVLALPR